IGSTFADPSCCARLPRPLLPAPFPYTTLFRSRRQPPSPGGPGLPQRSHLLKAPRRTKIDTHNIEHGRSDHHLKSFSSKHVCTVRPLSQGLAPGTTSGIGISARLLRFCDVEIPLRRYRSSINSCLT